MHTTAHHARPLELLCCGGSDDPKEVAAAKKILPAGAVLWAWDADPEFDEPAGEQWLVLLPKKWKRVEEAAGIQLAL